MGYLYTGIIKVLLPREALATKNYEELKDSVPTITLMLKCLLLI